MIVVINGQIKNRRCVLYWVWILINNYLQILYATGSEKDKFHIATVIVADKRLAEVWAAIRKFDALSVTLLTGANTYERGLPEEPNRLIKAQLGYIEGVSELEKSVSANMRYKL